MGLVKAPVGPLVSFSPIWAKRELMRVLEPGFRATAARHRAPLEEWTTAVDLGRAAPC